MTSSTSRHQESPARSHFSPVSSEYQNNFRMTSPLRFNGKKRGEKAIEVEKVVVRRDGIVRMTSMDAMMQEITQVPRLYKLDSTPSLPSNHSAGLIPPTGFAGRRNSKFNNTAYNTNKGLPLPPSPTSLKRMITKKAPPPLNLQHQIRRHNRLPILSSSDSNPRSTSTPILDSSKSTSPPDPFADDPFAIVSPRCHPFDSTRSTPLTSSIACSEWSPDSAKITLANRLSSSASGVLTRSYLKDSDTPDKIRNGAERRSSLSYALPVKPVRENQISLDQMNDAELEERTYDLERNINEAKTIISRDQMLESFLSTSRHKFAPLCEVSAAIAKSDASSQRILHLILAKASLVAESHRRCLARTQAELNRARHDLETNQDRELHLSSSGQRATPVRLESITACRPSSCLNIQTTANARTTLPTLSCSPPASTLDYPVSISSSSDHGYCELPSPQSEAEEDFPVSRTCSSIGSLSDLESGSRSSTEYALSSSSSTLESYLEAMAGLEREDEAEMDSNLKR